MAKGIFTSKVRSVYDDLPESRYHFPRTYLNQVRQCVGDSIIYYEPRRQDADDRGRDGRQAYFAAAQVGEIVEDPRNPDRFYALIDDYIEFTEPVPFRVGAEFFENSLRKQDGSTNRGAFGRAVRVLSDDEYEAILRAGFGHVIEPVKTQIVADRYLGLEETVAEFERPVREQLIKKHLETPLSQKMLPRHTALPVRSPD